LDTFREIISTVREVALAAKSTLVGVLEYIHDIFAELRAAIQNRSHVRRDRRIILTQLRFLKALLLHLVRTVIAVAMHPNRSCAYLFKLRELCLRHSHRAGPADHCSFLLTRQRSTCQGVVGALN
jgi:hypothetical protein